MKVHGSALKHGVSSEDAIQAADWPQWIEPPQDDEWPHRELRLGFDTQARLLETVVLIFDNGEELESTPCRRASSFGSCCPETDGALGPTQLWRVGTSR
ncbi:toxin [uncultured Jatrophihabitans sp.]|uniref:toxin n=1 Tax=uncultured Jatrophihabitans sp. TaxID=1610747 RepID=UPI0035CC2B17